MTEHFMAAETEDREADLQKLERADFDAPTHVLVWRRFKRHKLGVFTGVVLLLAYLALPFIEFLAPYPPNRFNEENVYARRRAYTSTISANTSASTPIPRQRSTIPRPGSWTP